MKLKTRSPFKTRVVATLFDEHGNVTNRQEGHNTISEGDMDGAGLHNGLIYLLENIFGAGTHFDPDSKIDYMELGTGTPNVNTVDGLGSPITSPTPTRIAIATKVMTGYNDPTMTATTTWAAPTFGAITGISEIGLFTDESPDNMFAYKTFTPALNKTALGNLVIAWDIQASYT
jgi:hypothetical protein